MVTKKKLTKEEWEAMTGTDMSFILPSDGGIETALESSLNDSGNREQAKSVEQVEVPFEPQQSPTGREEGIFRGVVCNREYSSCLLYTSPSPRDA